MLCLHTRQRHRLDPAIPGDRLQGEVEQVALQAQADVLDRQVWLVAAQELLRGFSGSAARASDMVVGVRPAGCRSDRRTPHPPAPARWSGAHGDDARPPGATGEDMGGGCPRGREQMPAGTSAQRQAVMAPVTPDVVRWTTVRRRTSERPCSADLCAGGVGEIEAGDRHLVDLADEDQPRSRPRTGTRGRLAAPLQEDARLRSAASTARR